MMPSCFDLLMIGGSLVVGLLICTLFMYGQAARYRRMYYELFEEVSEDRRRASKDEG